MKKLCSFLVVVFLTSALLSKVFAIEKVVLQIDSYSNWDSPGLAIDGDYNSYSFTNFFSNYIIYDCGSEKSITKIKLYFDYAIGYNLQGSNDKSSWTTLYSTVAGPHC